MEEVELYKIYFTITIGESEVVATHIIAAKSYDEANRYGDRTAAEENAWTVGYDEDMVEKLSDTLDNGDEDDIADTVATLEELAESIGKVWRYEDIEKYDYVVYNKRKYNIVLEASDEI